MFDLTGKAALVTGATGGIGGAIARALRSAGAAVAVSGTRRERLETLAGELGEGCAALPCNLADAGEAAGLAARAETALGGLDILVNNAGIARDSLALRMKEEDWRRVLDVNLTAAFLLSRAALRGMMRRRSGRIVSVGSVVGAAGNPGQTNYAASKAGLVGMSKALAAEAAARGVTVNCVAPGLVDTDMTRGLPTPARERMIAAIPLGRAGAVGEVAAAVLFLASDEAAYVTGQTLHVNGGMVMI